MAKTVADIMSKDLLTLTPDQDVREAATIMAAKGIGGAPVLENGRLVGIVTEDDLIMKDVKIHFPTFIHLLDGFIYLESIKRFEEQFRKMIGAKVKDVMTVEVSTIRSDAPIAEAATKLVDEDISRLPVVDETETVIGIVTKADLVKAIATEG